jgi:hypothetical protein
MTTMHTTTEAGMLAEPGKGFEHGKQAEDGSMEGSIEEIDPILEAKLVRKLDLHIIPVVMLLYLFSFLDR